MEGKLMDLLRDIESDIEQRQTQIRQLEEQLATLRSEVGELEIAAKVIRRKQGPTQALTPSQNGTAEPALFPKGEHQELEGKTIEESAVIILTERGNQPTHFTALAEEAHRRGYRGRSPNLSPDSFQTMMDRKSEVFERVGGGKYRLREDAKTGESWREEVGECTEGR
jgi:hypothetical protein